MAKVLRSWLALFSGIGGLSLIALAVMVGRDSGGLTTGVVMIGTAGALLLWVSGHLLVAMAKDGG